MKIAKLKKQYMKAKFKHDEDYENFLEWCAVVGVAGCGSVEIEKKQKFTKKLMRVYT